MKHLLIAIVMASFGFYAGLLRKRVEHLDVFRAKMIAYLIEIQETSENEALQFYKEKRIGILKECAMIKPYIYWWRLKRFDGGCSTYHTAQQTEEIREHNAFVHSLYPHSSPLAKDQRTLKEKISYAVAELADCANHWPGKSKLKYFSAT